MSSSDLAIELIVYIITGFLAEGFSMLNLIAWRGTPPGQPEKDNAFYEDFTFFATDSLIEVFAALAKIYFTIIGI